MIVITMDVVIIRLPTINVGNDDVGPNDSISIVVGKTCLSLQSWVFVSMPLPIQPNVDQSNFNE